MGNDYRIFVGAFPQGEIATLIQAVRERLDPQTARITPPHVTLAGTYWRSGPPGPENEIDLIGRLHGLRGRVPAFPLLLGEVRTFPPTERPVIYLGVQSTPQVQAARAALLEVAGADKHAQFVPHLTLAMRLTGDRAQAVVEELRTSEWHTGLQVAPIGELWLMQRGPDDPAWRRIARVKLRTETSDAILTN
jgi:2'-5' RNA ligase